MFTKNIFKKLNIKNHFEKQQEAERLYVGVCMSEVIIYVKCIKCSIC